MPREPEWLPRLFSGIWRLGGEFAVEAVGGGGEGAAGDGGGAEFAAELVDGLVELAGAVALFVGEEGELLGLAVGEVTEGDAEQAEGAAVPEFGEEGFGAVIELLRDVAGLGEAVLVGAVFEVTAADGDGEAEAAAAVGAQAGGDAVAQGEQDLIGLRDGGDVLLEGGGVAVAFDGLGLGEDGGGVDAAGVVVQEGGGADAGELLQVGEVRPGQIADRADAGGGELFGKGAADGEQVADGQRPELLRDLGGKKGMDLIGLFKVAGHFGQELVFGDADVDGEAELGENGVLDLVGDGERVWVEQVGAGHVEEAFVDRDLLHHGGEAAADGDEGAGIARIEGEIRRGEDELRAFAQRHADRLAGGDAEFFRGDGLGEDDAGALVPVAADGGGDGAQVRLACGDAARRLPGQKGTVDVYVKDQPLLHPAPSFGFRYVRSSWFRKQYNTNCGNMRTKFRKFYRVR